MNKEQLSERQFDERAMGVEGIQRPPIPPHRVGAICDADSEQVRLFGFGVLIGEEAPPPNVKIFGAPLDHPNPKIQLDNGKIVWGCECWWGDEAEVKRVIAGRTVVEVDIEQMRKEASASKEPDESSDAVTGAGDK